MGTPPSVRPTARTAGRDWDPRTERPGMSPRKPYPKKFVSVCPGLHPWSACQCNLRLCTWPSGRGRLCALISCPLASQAYVWGALPMTNLSLRHGACLRRLFDMYARARVMGFYIILRARRLAGDTMSLFREPDVACL